MLLSFLVSGAVAVVPGLCQIPGIKLIDMLKICGGHHQVETEVDGKDTGTKKLEVGKGRPGKPKSPKTKKTSKTTWKPMMGQKKTNKKQRFNFFNLNFKRRTTPRPWEYKGPTKRPMPSSSTGREKRGAEKGQKYKKAVNRLAKRVKRIETSLDRKIWTEMSLTRKVERLERKMQAMERKGREVDAKLDHLMGEIGSGSEDVDFRSQTSLEESTSDPTSEVGSGYQDWIYAPQTWSPTWSPREGFWSEPDPDSADTKMSARNRNTIGDALEK